MLPRTYTAWWPAVAAIDVPPFQALGKVATEAKIRACDAQSFTLEERLMAISGIAFPPPHSQTSAP